MFDDSDTGGLDWDELYYLKYSKHEPTTWLTITQNKVTSKWCSL